MGRPGLRLRGAALLRVLACQPRQAAVYAPWEEGLTLAYENPTLPQPARSAGRLQVRVARSPVAPGGPAAIQLDLTSTQGRTSVNLLCRAGGVSLVAPDGQSQTRLLPEGFPAGDTWTERGITFRVVGRGAWQGARLLPPGTDPVGVWVEATPAHGPRHRTLYLPDLGEVESLEERAAGWTTVNLLVARGFTDLPSLMRP